MNICIINCSDKFRKLIFNLKWPLRLGKGAVVTVETIYIPPSLRQVGEETWSCSCLFFVVCFFLQCADAQPETDTLVPKKELNSRFLMQQEKKKRDAEAALLQEEPQEVTDSRRLSLRVRVSDGTSTRRCPLEEVMFYTSSFIGWFVCTNE